MSHATSATRRKETHQLVLNISLALCLGNASHALGDATAVTKTGEAIVLTVEDSALTFRQCPTSYSPREFGSDNSQNSEKAKHLEEECPLTGSNERVHSRQSFYEAVTNYYYEKGFSLKTDSMDPEVKRMALLAHRHKDSTSVTLGQERAQKLKEHGQLVKSVRAHEEFLDRNPDAPVFVDDQQLRLLKSRIQSLESELAGRWSVSGIDKESRRVFTSVWQSHFGSYFKAHIEGPFFSEYGLSIIDGSTPALKDLHQILLATYESESALGLIQYNSNTMAQVKRFEYVNPDTLVFKLKGYGIPVFLNKEEASIKLHLNTLRQHARALGEKLDAQTLKKEISLTEFDTSGRFELIYSQLARFDVGSSSGSSRQETRNLNVHFPEGGAKFSSDNQSLFAVDTLGNLLRWAFDPTKKDLATAFGESLSVSSFPLYVKRVFFSPNQDFVFLDGRSKNKYKNEAGIIDVKTGKSHSLWYDSMAYNYRPSFSADGKYFSGLAYDGTFGIWDSRTGQRIALKTRHPEYHPGGFPRVQTQFFRTIPEHIVTTTLEGVVVLDIHTSAPVRSMEGSASKRFSDISLSSDDRFIAAIDSATGDIDVWDANTGLKLRTLFGAAKGDIGFLAFNPSNSSELSALTRTAVGAWNWQKAFNGRIPF
jgi:WD40 repeat protein